MNTKCTMMATHCASPIILYCDMFYQEVRHQLLLSAIKRNWILPPPAEELPRRSNPPVSVPSRPSPPPSPTASTRPRPGRTHRRGRRRTARTASRRWSSPPPSPRSRCIRRSPPRGGQLRSRSGVGISPNIAGGIPPPCRMPWPVRSPRRRRRTTTTTTRRKSTYPRCRRRHCRSSSPPSTRNPTVP